MIQVGIMFKSFLLTSQMNFLSSTKTLTSVGETKCVCVCTKEGPVNHYFKSTKLSFIIFSGRLLNQGSTYLNYMLALLRLF